MRPDTDPAFEEPFAVRAGLDIMSLLRFALLGLARRLEHAEVGSLYCLGIVGRLQSRRRREFRCWRFVCKPS
jgi:hypothetical protein